MFPASVQQASADVMVTVFDRQAVPASLALAADLRNAGLRVELYPEADKLGKQMKYAAGKGIPFAAILGSDEIEKGVVTVKNLATGQQETWARGEVAERLRAARAEKPGTAESGQRTAESV
jgi:histidyl-tRNA synthetase